MASSPTAPDLFASPQSPTWPDTQTAISATCSPAKDPTQDDWCELLRCMRYLMIAPTTAIGSAMGSSELVVSVRLQI